MSPFYVAVQLALAATFVGLVRRGRWRLCLSFVAYLLFGLIVALLMNEWPDRFWTRSLFMSVQGVANLLRLAIGLEIAWRTLQIFPGAWGAARRFGLAILSLTAVTALAPSIAAADPDPYVVAVTLVSPRVENGILWLMGLTLVIALWYRVPVHPFHAAMLTSFVTYQASALAIFSLLRYGYATSASLSASSTTSPTSLPRAGGRTPPGDRRHRLRSRMSTHCAGCGP